jgi:hypothetical protein
MQIESTRIFCIYCRQAIILPMGGKSQYHQNCWDAVKNYKNKNKFKLIFTNKIATGAKKIYFFININIFHGLLKNNLGFVSVIPKRALFYSSIWYISLLLILLLMQ